MFEKVLVALDFSAHSQHILDHILEIPGVQEVVLMHVVDATRPSVHGWTHGPHIENTKILMAEKKEALEQAGLTVHVHVDVLVNAITEGSVPQALLEIAETHEVSLIVVGARGVNPIRELLLGSVSSTVLRHAKTSVLVLHTPLETGDAEQSPCPTRRGLFSKILVPTDFSKHAGETLTLVTTIPGVRDVILMNVVNRGDSQAEIEAAVTEARSRLDGLKKEFGAGIGITTHVRVGDPTGMILSVAQEDDVSLIAMSAFGTGWFREILLGSTTFTVVRQTKRPVLVIRTGLAEENARDTA